MENQSFTCNVDNLKSRVNLLTTNAIQKFIKNYGIFPKSSVWRFLVNDYYATGEGRTISLLITQALPGLEEDYDVEFNGYGTITTKEYRAIRQFYEIFGEWDSVGVEFMPEDHFFGTYSNCLPPILQNIRNDCHYEFYTQIHFNAS